MKHSRDKSGGPGMGLWLFFAVMAAVLIGFGLQSEGADLQLVGAGAASLIVPISLVAIVILLAVIAFKRR